MRKTVKIITLMLVAALACLALAACGGSRLKSISVAPDTTEFVAGDVIDADSVTVNAVYTDGSTRTVSGWTTDATEPLTAGERTVTFRYTENGVTATATLDITVAAAEHAHEFGGEWQADGQSHFRLCSCGAREDEQAHVRAGITVVEESACEIGGRRSFVCSVCGYVGDESIDALGHNYTVDRADDLAHWKDCSRCDASGEKTAHAFELYIYDMRTKYSPGDRFSLDGARAEIECADCDYIKQIDASDVHASADVIGDGLGDRTVTLTYGDAETTVSIEVVVKELIGVRADAAKNKTAYRPGDSFESGKLTLVYSNQTTADIDLTADMVTGFATDGYGGRRLTVSYGGFDCTLDIATVKDIAASGGYIKFQAEDAGFVDMSAAESQEGANDIDGVNDKFEHMLMTATGGKIPNGAEGACTSNISVEGNKITLRFFALASGKFTLGMRAQSTSGKGRADQPIEQALALTVNGKPAAISGLIGKATAGDTDWRDMDRWTLLDDIAGELPLAAGANVIEFAFLGETAADMRFPNIDFFTVNIAYNDGVTVEVSGDAQIPYGGAYTGGLTLDVKEGGKTLASGVPVTADMISGLDNMQEGEQNVTVTYFGVTARHTVEVVINRLTLTVDGGTFADGSTSKQLVYGETIPEITWTKQNIIGWAFDGTVLRSIDGLTMSSTDTTLKAISAADATKINLPTAIRYNRGPTADDTGKTTGSVESATAAATAAVNVFGTGDGRSYKPNKSNANARGLTLKGDINFGAGKVYVFVKVINNSGSELKSVAYGTEIGKIDLGDIAAGGSAETGKVIASDNSGHWTNIFWDGAVTSLDLTIAVYTYAVA